MPEAKTDPQCVRLPEKTEHALQLVGRLAEIIDALDVLLLEPQPAKPLLYELNIVRRKIGEAGVGLAKLAAQLAQVEEPLVERCPARAGRPATYPPTSEVN